MDKELVKKHILMDEDIYVNIIDEVMGKGKTSAAINFINESSEDVHFLYITPYLSEVNRIIKECPNKNFKQPEKKISKLNSIKSLFDKKENIVSTHALFRYFDEEVIDIAYTNNYILIMDEVAEVIEQYYVSKDDLNDILTNYAHVDPDTHLLIWDYQEYKGTFDNIKKLCDLRSMTVYKDTAMLWLFPITTFRAFRETYILTYMFSAQTQSYYYNYYHIGYNRLYVECKDNNYRFVKEKPANDYSEYDYRKLINICDNNKLNSIGDKPNALSFTWYERNKNNSLINQLKKNTQNYFRNILKSPSDNIIWTTFKDYQKEVSGQGYAKGFVPSNMRATNEYADRSDVAYLVNKFFNPYIKQFFVLHGVSVEEDNYAISEMLQFIWRSSIRTGKPINIYIPSKRMRDLLIRWIESQSYNDGDDIGSNDVIDCESSITDVGVVDFVDIECKEVESDLVSNSDNNVCCNSCNNDCENKNKDSDKKEHKNKTKSNNQKHNTSTATHNVGSVEIKTNGDFYFGFNSLVYRDNGVAQIKCIKRGTGNKLEIVFLQFNNNEDLNMFDNIEYILNCNIECVKCSPTIYDVINISETKDVVPDKYNGKLVGSIQKKLMSMKTQKRFKKR